jgi:sortase A
MITQARLTRRFERTRTAKVRTVPLVPTPEPATLKPAKPEFIPPGIASLARLEIPRIGLSAMVLEGADSRTLRVGLGHIPGTSSPGDHGNVAIAGHRDTFFRPLRHVEAGDEIVLETPTNAYRYHVTSVEVVSPSDIAVLRSHEKDALTLVTCYPFFYLGRAPKRFIVHQSLVHDRFSQNPCTIVNS